MLSKEENGLLKVSVSVLRLMRMLLDACGRAGYIFVLVERAKKCLDFTATMYIIHLILCVLYNGFPTSFLWWFVYIVCVVVTSLLGEWLCMRRELKDIPMRSTRLGQFHPPFLFSLFFLRLPLLCLYPYILSMATNKTCGAVCSGESSIQLNIRLKPPTKETCVRKLEHVKAEMVKSIKEIWRKWLVVTCSPSLSN